MRKTLVLGCCALLLAFGPVAGTAHVHESADHHVESRGLHFDHGHLSDSVGHDHHHAHHHDHPHEAVVDRDVGFETRHAEHHEGDALYLNATAARSGDSSFRPLPAIVCVGTAIDPPSAVPTLDDAVTGRPRDPPRKIPPRLRAPPA